MRWEIVCLSVSNMCLTDEMTMTLARAAWMMLQELEKEYLIYWEELRCAGVIRTNFERVVFVHFGGVVFEAELETERGKAFVRFLANDRDPDFFASLSDEELICKSPAEFLPGHDAYKYN